MFVKFTRGALLGDKWRFPGTVVNLPEDRARGLIKEGSARLDSGPEVEVLPEPDPSEESEEPVKRGPGRPRKDA